jgi:hypothetical protein
VKNELFQSMRLFEPQTPPQEDPSSPGGGAALGQQRHVHLAAQQPERHELRRACSVLAQHVGLPSSTSGMSTVSCAERTALLECMLSDARPSGLDSRENCTSKL